MNHVTFETAKRLKEAGFLPAIPEFGQTWYDDFGSPFLVAGLTPIGYSIVRSDTFSKRSTLNGCVFAPTATDILRKLDGWAIAQKTYNGKTRWTCWLPSHEPPEDDENEFYHENPAEACALTWMAMNEKK